MKATAILSAVASLLSLATAATAESPFKPPQVWKNANLVHIISLEKNYVKENINVLVENVDNRPHDEYYVPFTADQLSRLGGVEVKDRKDPTVGPFGAELVEVKERLVITLEIGKESVLRTPCQRHSVSAHPAPRARRPRRPTNPRYQLLPP